MGERVFKKKPSPSLVPPGAKSKPQATPPPIYSLEEQVLYLQRTVGNQAVQHLLQRQDDPYKSIIDLMDDDKEQSPKSNKEGEMPPLDQSQGLGTASVTSVGSLLRHHVMKSKKSQHGTARVYHLSLW